MKRGNITDDDNARRGNALALHHVERLLKRGNARFLLRARSPHNRSTRRSSRNAVGGQTALNVRQIFHAHIQNNARAAGDKPRQRLPIRGALLLAGVFVTGYERYRRGNSAMRGGNARVHQRRNATCYAWYHLECNAVLVQNERFFAAAPENVRVAAFQAHHVRTHSPFSGIIERGHGLLFKGVIGNTFK